MFTVYLTGLWYILDGRFLCTVWALSMHWVDVSHETTSCLVCWIPDITDWSTLQLKPFNNICEVLLYQISFLVGLCDVSR